MLTARFERLLRRLLSGFIVYDDASRKADEVEQLAAFRVELDRARDEIAVERVVVHHRAHAMKNLNMTALSDYDIAVLRVRGMISN